MENIIISHTTNSQPSSQPRPLKDKRRRFYAAFLENLWPRQESNLDPELRKLIYYPLYYEAIKTQQK